MSKNLISIIVLLFLAVITYGAFTFLGFRENNQVIADVKTGENTNTTEKIETKKVETKKVESWECDGDGKICPDGSMVGRSGPRCEFTACPSLPVDYPKAISIGETYADFGINVTPIEVITDSRCPSGVNCIWAGEVGVRSVITSKVGHGEHILVSYKPQVFGEYTVTLTQVFPQKSSGTNIPTSSYRFIFEIRKI